MANIKQQKKRIGTAQRQRLENLRYRSTVKTLFNKLQAAVDTGEREVAEKTHKELVSLLDRAASRSSLHRNTASRRKARAARILLQEAKTDATTIRKAKKKAAPVARKPKADAAAKKPAAKKAPAKKAEADAPVEEPVVEETPEAKAADETPAEETPVVAEPVVEETPDDAPADHTPEADAPAEDAKD
ncbi:MAG: ribosomal protein [Thermoleophilia bacterium]|nr:ribosomal protein [Thermoleophilia bacterium]